MGEKGEAWLHASGSNLQIAIPWSLRNAGYINSIGNLFTYAQIPECTIHDLHGLRQCERICILETLGSK